MTGKTTIEWTAQPGYEGASWNPTVGCTRVSAGCDNCYAFALHDKQLGSVPVESEELWRSRALTRVLSARNARRAPDGTVPIALRESHGRDMAEWPEDLRIRDWPR